MVENIISNFDDKHNSLSYGEHLPKQMLMWGVRKYNRDGQGKDQVIQQKLRGQVTLVSSTLRGSYYSTVMTELNWISNPCYFYNLGQLQLTDNTTAGFHCSALGKEVYFKEYSLPPIEESSYPGKPQALKQLPRDKDS